MTSPSEDGQLPPKADEQLDLSAEVPTARSYESPLLLDDLGTPAVPTPLPPDSRRSTKSVGDLGPVPPFLAIALAAVATAGATAALARLSNAPGFVVLPLALTVGAGIFITGFLSCMPSIHGTRG